MMKKLFMFLMVGLIIASCSNDGPKKVDVGNDEKVIATFANGKPQIVREFEVIDGVPVASYEKEYYDDGNLLKEGPIVNSNRHGYWKTYYRSGKLWNEGSFYEGALHDTVKGYYTDGQLKYQGIYKNGSKTGMWLFFDEDGKLTDNKVYMQPGETREDTLYMVQ